MDDPYSQPEAAIRCFERWSGTTVTVHDLGGSLGPYLGPGRHWHATTVCQAVKHSPNGHHCIRWDQDRVRTAIASELGGRVQICHAGLVELMVPVLRQGHCELVLFAGQRSAGPGLRASRDREANTPLPSGSPLPAVIGNDEAHHILEGLRQLGARLGSWLAETIGTMVAERLPAPNDRRHAISAFIHAEHHRGIGLGDLARHLGLSIHRTSHVVKLTCKRTFIDLITEARLRSACAMLAHTQLSIQELSHRAGFGDADHFHRVFRRRYGSSPGEYRRQVLAREV